MNPTETPRLQGRKVVVFAGILAPQMDLLERAGLQIIKLGEREVDAVLEALVDADGTVASVYVQFDDDVFARCPRLKVVGRMGVGVDNIDLEAAARHGVQVVNTPEPIVEPVAEHTISLLLALSRNLVRGDRNTREGRFRHETDAPGPELLGKTLGLVGFGNTGRRVAEMARAAFGMQILYADALPAPPDFETRLAARRVELDELLSSSDFVSVHVSLNPSTRGLFSAEQFARMKPTAYFVNCSRGPVVDEAALCEALREGRIRGAALDVFVEEPPPRNHPLFELPNVILTPHRAGQSEESLVGCSRVVEDVLRVLQGEQPHFPVAR